MILQVIVDDKVVYTDTVDYDSMPQHLVSEFERTWRIHEMQEQGIPCGIAIVVQSIMNTKTFSDLENYLECQI